MAGRLRARKLVGLKGFIRILNVFKMFESKSWAPWLLFKINSLQVLSMCTPYDLYNHRDRGGNGNGRSWTGLRGAGLYASSGGYHAGCIRTKDRIELFNFAIEFSDQLRNFHQNLSELCKFSALLTEFGYFKARSRNSDKISSRFRREIAIFLQKLWCSDWIFNIQFRKIGGDFWLNFRDWSGAKECWSCRSPKMQ